MGHHGSTAEYRTQVVDSRIDGSDPVVEFSRFVQTSSWNFNDLRQPVVNKRMYRPMCISAPGKYGKLLVREPVVKTFESHHLFGPSRF